MRSAARALSVLVAGFAVGGVRGLQVVSPENGGGHEGVPSAASTLDAAWRGATSELDVLGVLGGFARAAERDSRSFLASARAEVSATEGALRDAFDSEGGDSVLPPERWGLHFRPVSCTLYCIMVLTGEGLLVFSLLAIARTVEDLTTRRRDRQATASEALLCAARGATIIPMLCMLFIACRMYVLATSDGLGEEPLWVQICMVVATLGVTFQFLVVLLLPFAAEPSTEDGRRLPQLTGEASDAHPMLWAHKYHSNGTKSLVYGVQVVAMVCIYGGACGVIVGVFAYPAGAAAVSAAVICTVLLSLLYFGIYLASWILRTRAEIQLPRSEQLAAAKAAVLAASVPIRKVPMFLVVFLAASMRALQLAPPLGRPPWWAEVCCYVICVALTCEAAAAAYIGAVGEEDPRRSAMGEYSCVAAPSYHLVQHLCGCIAYLGILTVVSGIFHAKGLDGQEYPLSSTMKALLQLAALFLSVSMLQAAVACYQDVTRNLLPKLQRTASAASVGVTICPLLAVLFVAVRLRALQITDQRGAPPGWAQNLMFLCVFATFAQLACCLALPVLTGSAAEVDEEGESKHDAGSLLRAYTVSSVRYFALLCLHGSTAALCVAALTMTPDTATGRDARDVDEWQDLLQFLGIIVFVALVALVLSSAKVVGVAVKYTIEAIDRQFIGTDIEVGRANINLCRGCVVVEDLVVLNPAGREWSSSHLLRIDTAVIDIGMGELIRSFGKVIKVECVKFQGIEVCYDLPKLNKNSNLQEIVEFLQRKDEDPGGDGKETTPQALASARSAEAVDKSKSDKPNDKESKEKREVIIEELDFSDIGASAYLSGMLVKIELDDIKYKDFSASALGNKPATTALVVKTILMTLLKTVLANQKLVSHNLMAAGKNIKEVGKAAGKHIIEATKDARRRAEEAGQAASENLKQAGKNIEEASQAASENLKQAGKKIEEATKEAQHNIVQGFKHSLDALHRHKSSGSKEAAERASSAAA